MNAYGVMPRYARFANFNPSVRALSPRRWQREYPNAAAFDFSFCIQIHSNFEKIIDFSTSRHKSPQSFGIFALVDNQRQIIQPDRKRPGGRVARVRIATATGRCGFESHLNRTFVEDCDWWNFFGLQLHPQRSSMATPSCLHGAASTMDALVLAILAFFVYGWLCSPSVCGFSLLLASL